MWAIATDPLFPGREKCQDGSCSARDTALRPIVTDPAEHGTFKGIPWGKCGTTFRRQPSLVAAFVEHLRTVQFTLVTIAAGLILLVLTSKPYNPAVALIELEKIIELKTPWSPDLIKRIGDPTDFINVGAVSEVDLPPSGASRFPCPAAAC